MFDPLCESTFRIGASSANAMGIEVAGVPKPMTTDNNFNPANEPNTFPPNPTQAPTAAGLPEKEGDKKDKVDQVADRLAQKGAKTEQDYEKDNINLITK